MRYLRIVGVAALVVVIVGAGLYFYTNRFGPLKAPSLSSPDINTVGFPPDPHNAQTSGINAPPPDGQVMQNPPMPIGGVVDHVDGNTIAIKDKDGAAQTLQISDKSIVQTLVVIKQGDMRQDDQVMIFGTRENDRFHAAQVRIANNNAGFMGGGLPIDTGATQDPKIRPEPLTGTVAQIDQSSFVVKSRDGSSKTTVDVINGGTIVKQQDIQVADIKPGDTVMAIATKNGDDFQIMQIIKVNSELVPKS